MDKSIWNVYSGTSESLWYCDWNSNRGGMMGYTSMPSQSLTENKKYSENELLKMTSNQIKQLASDKGYSLSSTNKAGLISEFLIYQG